MLASELRDASSARDRSVSELYRVRQELQELQELRTGQAETRAECGRLADELDRARGATRHRAVRSCTTHLYDAPELALCLQLLFLALC